MKQRRKTCDITLHLINGKVLRQRGTGREKITKEIRLARPAVGINNGRGKWLVITVVRINLGMTHSEGH